MREYRVCKVCNEYKKHHAHGMCGSCYRKERYKECYKDRRAKKPKIGKPINPQCSIYLGCTIAEKVLSRVFNNVEIMPYGNPGYDFICNRGKKIDVKSACIRENRWVFNINKNMVADFFLCIAFNNRKSLIPLHLWLLPSSKMKGKKTAGICPNTIPKWNEFKLDISKTLQCCDEMRS